MGANPRLIRARLLDWYDRGHRDLPWRRTRDPYAIWISEIMLQQTRVQAVIPYYEKFLRRFPTLESLARASQHEVLACWSGLGYYSRARNLHQAARQIGGAGAFPRDYESIRLLAGVGDYTAAAVASIAFDLPHAVMDGNVMRVIARLGNDAADIAASATRARFRGIAQQLLDRRQPGRFNQALMEQGATVCLPRRPLCPSCPLNRCCEAHGRGTADQLPVKLRRIQPVEIAETLLLIERGGRILLREREAHQKRMAGFWELPSPEQLRQCRAGETLGVFRHTITHHHYTFTVVAGAVKRAPKGFRWFRREELETIPLSTTAKKGLGIRGTGSGVRSVTRTRPSLEFRTPRPY
jgi:A/G-specific adenine glycosylase